MSGALDIQTPRWAVPLLEPARYKGAHGGRGSGKSHERAEALVEEHILDGNQRSVCLREVQKSIKYSVKQLLEDKIQKFEAGDYFEIQESCIKSKHGTGIILFQGMQNHTADSIKSLEGFDRAWFEEAQNASQRSLDLLRPTIRKEGSELWFTWNPESEEDPIDKLLRGDNTPPSSIVVEVNYEDNPWFPDVLREEMEYDRQRDYDKFLWIWCGQYRKISEALVFKNWRVEEFDTDPDAVLRFGADWGFANDPTILIRSYIQGRKLYVDYESCMHGCEIEDTPDLFDLVPESRRWPIIADSARPETISYMRNHGFPKIMASKKGAGSLNEGVEFLKSYDIIVHPRCVQTIKELKTYRYKIDKDTEEVLPILEDKDNHVIDGLRYSHEGGRKAKEVAARERPKGKVLPTRNRWSKSHR